MWGMAALESSTGEFWVLEGNGDSAAQGLHDELYRLDPREVLYPNDLAGPVRDMLSSLTGRRLCPRDPSEFDLRPAERLLCEQFRVASLDGFGCSGMTCGIQAAGAVLRYLRDTQPSVPLNHLSRLQVRHADEAMHLDSATIRNLELIQSMSGHRQNAALLSVLDRTISAMGGRLMRQWIVRPLLQSDPFRCGAASGSR
jgi:DNA mismatch repair protein MutS